MDNSTRSAENRKLEIGRYSTKIDWSLMFHEIVHSGLDIIMPEKQIRIHPTAWSVFTSIQILPEPCQ